MPPRGSLRSVREANRLRIVDALRSKGEASRSELVRATGLSRATVSTLVADLQEEGLVVERENAQPVAGLAQVGRPPALLALDHSAGAAVGVDFDHDQIGVAVSDLSRRVLAEMWVARDVDHDARGALHEAAELVASVLEEAGVDRERVLGVGMALAGPVDQARGSVHPSAILPGWTDVDAADELAAELGLPVHLENDANLGALAEVTFGAAQGARYAAFVMVSSGIGAGLVVEGRPYRGHRGIAGEIGHILVDPLGPICRCGNRGCLETLASGPALVELVGASRDDVGDLADVIRLANDGDKGCRRGIEDAGRSVGRVLASLVNLFSPETIVVGGAVAGAGELLLGPIRETVNRFALPAATEGLAIVPGALGARANLLGAVALVLQQSEPSVGAIAGRPVTTSIHTTIGSTSEEEG